jgi:Cyclopropane fatty acid synthase and related methyltransferases
MRQLLLPALLCVAAPTAAVLGQTDVPKEAAVEMAQPPTPEAVEVLRREAARLMPMFGNIEIRKVLLNTTWLPLPDTRTLYTDGKGRWFSQAEYDKLAEEQRAELRAVEFDDYRFYYTKYGTPMAYIRALDLAAAAMPGSLQGKKVMDFGYGTIGHLRLMASRNMYVVGVDVDPMLAALYSDPEDTGTVQGEGLDDKPPPGTLTLVHGRWPKDQDAIEKVGGEYDLITSKNTLKNGYINPEEPVDPRLLVDLGVPAEVFVEKVAAALKPGGLFLIYNISPKQKPKGEGYIPWADGRCPFPREMLEKAGFEILEYNKDDSPFVRRMGEALDWDKGERAMDLENDCFAEYTLVRKKPAPAQSEVQKP